MGTKLDSGELAKALTPQFQRIPGAHVIQHNVIIAGKDKIEHDKALHEAFQMVSESGMTLNPINVSLGKRKFHSEE